MLDPKKAAPLLARRGLLTAGTAGAAATLIGCGNDNKAAPAAKVTTVTYLTGFRITAQDAPMYVAKEKGYFRDAGLDVDIQPGAGTQRNLATLKSGQAQFACIDVAGGIIE